MNTQDSSTEEARAILMKPTDLLDFENRWINLEGFILDEDYLSAGQSRIGRNVRHQTDAGRARPDTGRFNLLETFLLLLIPFSPGTGTLYWQGIYKLRF